HSPISGVHSGGASCRSMGMTIRAWRRHSIQLTMQTVRRASSLTRSRGAAFPSWRIRCCGTIARHVEMSSPPPSTSCAARMRDGVVRAVSELAAEDPSIALITGDLGFGVLTDFATRFPGSYLNAGVAEQNMTAVACGMALAGARAYTYSIGNFPTLRCLEQ